MILDNEILPHGYTIYRKDRVSRGGGVLIAIKNTILTKSLPLPSNLELLAIELIESNHVIVVTYLPPNSDTSQTITYLRQFFDRKIILTGDFNLPEINWNTMVGSTLNCNLFCDFVFESNLSQLVTVPTHCRGNCLDLVLTNFPDEIVNLQVDNSTLLKSDHLLVFFSLMTSYKQKTLIQEPHFVIDFSKLNYTDLANYILDYDFSSCLYTHNVELAWNHLRFTLHNAISQFAPKVKLKPRKCFPKWYNSEIRLRLNRTRHFRKQAKCHPTTANVNRLEREDNYLNQLMTTSKMKFEASLVEEFAYSNSNKIYKYINNLLKRDNIPETMHFESQLATCDLEKASLFNQFFRSVYTTSDMDDKA